jgi:hypothetical protein
MAMEQVELTVDTMIGLGSAGKQSLGGQIWGVSLEGSSECLIRTHGSGSSLEFASGLRMEAQESYSTVKTAIGASFDDIDVTVEEIRYPNGRTEVFSSPETMSIVLNGGGGIILTSEGAFGKVILPKSGIVIITNENYTALKALSTLDDVEVVIDTVQSDRLGKRSWGGITSTLVLNAMDEMVFTSIGAVGTGDTDIYFGNGVNIVIQETYNAFKAAI